MLVRREAHKWRSWCDSPEENCLYAIGLNCFQESSFSYLVFTFFLQRSSSNLNTSLIFAVFPIYFVVETTLIEAIAFEFEMSLFLMLIIFWKELYFTEILQACRNFILIKRVLAYVLLSYLNLKN